MNMNLRKNLLTVALLIGSSATASTSPVDYVNTLVGTQSTHALSTGNTYPAIALPWGMNFWMPQTGKMGDGWAYTYDAGKLRGIKQTHQPSPWINDYGQFAIMATTGRPVFDEDIYAAISLETCVEKRLTYGAPGPERMREVIAEYKKILQS